MSKEDPCASQQGGSPGEARFTVLVTSNVEVSGRLCKGRFSYWPAAHKRRRVCSEYCCVSQTFSYWPRFQEPQPVSFLEPLGANWEARCRPQKQKQTSFFAPLFQSRLNIVNPNTFQYAGRLWDRRWQLLQLEWLNSRDVHKTKRISVSAADLCVLWYWTWLGYGRRVKETGQDVFPEDLP